MLTLQACAGSESPGNGPEAAGPTTSAGQRPADAGPVAMPEPTAIPTPRTEPAVPAAPPPLGEHVPSVGSTPWPDTPPPSNSPSPQEANLRGRVLLEGSTGSDTATIEVSTVPEEVMAETVVEGLRVPWELAFTPDGRILVTERAGAIRVIQDGVLREDPLAILDVASVSESGLMGLAVHPDFADNHYLYVCYTYRDGGGSLRNRVARLTEVNGSGVDHRVLLDDIPGARNHDGCRLRFGPDGKLYVTMGDAQRGENAQDLASLSGKVLRLEADGSVPPDNPFSGSYVYTYGHRNPQGLDWHPSTGDLFITEHGPDRDDEVNILEPGANYGWPRVTGPSASSEYHDPIQAFTPTLALAGASFYTGDRLVASWDGNFIFATLKASHLHRLVLAPPGFRTVQSQQRLFDQQFGRLRAVAMGPEGYLYFTTSNWDGRGSPSPGDDKVMRLVPAPAGPPARYELAHPDFEFLLEPGTYRLGISAPGFQPAGLRAVVPKTGAENLGDIRLHPIGGGVP